MPGVPAKGVEQTERNQAPGNERDANEEQTRRQSAFRYRGRTETANAERRTQNAERRTQNAERRTQSVER